MIVSFRDGVTEAVFHGRAPKGLPADLERAARRKLRLLDAAEALADLRSPPGNRLHALERDRLGQHTISIDDPFRVYFRWTGAGPAEVEIADDHRGIETMTEDAPLPPMHPGEVLRDEFMVPLGLDAEALGRACGAPGSLVAEIAAERGRISGDVAIRFGRVFDTTPEFWMNLQQRFDLESAALALGDAVDEIKPLDRAA